MSTWLSQVYLRIKSGHFSCENISFKRDEDNDDEVLEYEGSRSKDEGPGICFLSFFLAKLTQLAMLCQSINC